MAGIRLHTFWSILRNYVLEATQTRTVSNFGAFYYMFIVNVGLYKEPKIHQKLKQKHAFYLENTKIEQSVCTEVLFVLDLKKTQVKNVFPIQISVFSAAAVIAQKVDPWDKLLVMNVIFYHLLTDRGTGPDSSVGRVSAPGNGRSRVRSRAVTYQSRKKWYYLLLACQSD